MMTFFRSIAGMVRVCITSADVGRILQEVNKAGISVFDVERTNELTVNLTVNRQDYRSLMRLIKRKGAELRIQHRMGIYWTAKKLFRRPVMVIGSLILLTASLLLPTRILFIEVEGNELIPDKRILESAAASGIYFGADREAVRSEQVKNRLLASVSQLQWAGVNTYGCRAVISVRERVEQQQAERAYGVSSIVAARDGVIRAYTVTKGNALCVTGQAVKEGEILVSGYTDCGICIQATQAEAEVYAQTSRELTVLTPMIYNEKGSATHTVKKYSILIGKKRINLYNDSGISGTTCDKIYSEYYLTLPGGFRLPVAIAVEQWTAYDSQAVSEAAVSAQMFAAEFAKDYLLDQMISGQILSSDLSAIQQADVCCLQGRFDCLEMIARVQNEEIFGAYGESD